MGYTVKLFVYDVSRGLARQLSQGLLGQHIDGVWHTAIVVHDREFFYGGSGIESCTPCGTILGQPDERITLGETDVPLDMFQDYLSEMGKNAFLGAKYSLFEHNCNTFSSEVAQFLTGNNIPSRITELPSVVLATPMGQMIKGMVENVVVTPNVGEDTRHY